MIIYIIIYISHIYTILQISSYIHRIHPGGGGAGPAAPLLSGEGHHRVSAGAVKSGDHQLISRWKTIGKP